MKFTVLAIIAASTAFAKQDYFNRVNEMLDETVVNLQGAQDYIKIDVQPTVTDLKVTTKDLKTTVDNEVDFDKLQNWDQINEQIDEIDWILIGDKVKAIDVNHMINWERVDSRIEKVNKRAEHF